MKFTDLSSHQRSMLAMLCTGQPFNTEQLGRGCSPRRGPSTAAEHLLRMRDAGLVFSSQKGPGETYCSWKATTYGKSVFESRPVEALVFPYPPSLAGPSVAPQKPYRVLRVANNGVTLFTNKFESVIDADRYARTNIHGASSDTVNYVVTLHKSMRFVPQVVQPAVEVEDL
ncbi:hypothetical protein PssvBMR6_gp16 [Pseudomonas phage MR6]|uniref:Uncharacterized protein n=1 Tax=Pseudomonas phage MR5 TaxID=2711172 RepID=A0A6M3TCS6_9CAUD|nr:hypothetical protein PssvBMR5_gp16 [Pseudomonas phage MR5]QJD54844.1 hypothetical protein PssvBMR6_gp16 [Pseudomonas phage MR6]QJD54903.1 hypothetical protein PssvBMR7_gp16 [Pseudomonas phage MR7]QJF74585.1 hypothetical protein PssvBMR16_gp16 [Pseudomonas phage MR16]